MLSLNIDNERPECLVSDELCPCQKILSMSAATSQDSSSANRRGNKITIHICTSSKLNRRSKRLLVRLKDFGKRIDSLHLVNVLCHCVSCFELINAAGVAFVPCSGN